MGADHIFLRAATPLDAGAMGAILIGFERNTEWMPKTHSEAEAISFCGVMIDRGWCTVAEKSGKLCGFMARDDWEVCALYLAPEAQGQGIGRQLLETAKSQCSKLELWTFQANQGAQRFYLREGFQEIERTDGHRNAEQLPDIRYLWQRPHDTVDA